MIEERYETLQQAKDDLKVQLSKQNREISELTESRDKQFKSFEKELREKDHDLKQERDRSFAIEKEMIKLRAELDRLRSEKEEWTNTIGAAHQREKQFKKDAEMYQERCHQLEKQLNEKQHEFTLLQVEEQKRMQAIEETLNTYLRVNANKNQAHV